MTLTHTTKFKLMPMIALSKDDATLEQAHDALLRLLKNKSLPAAHKRALYEDLIKRVDTFKLDLNARQAPAVVTAVPQAEPEQDAPVQPPVQRPRQRRRPKVPGAHRHPAARQPLRQLPPAVALQQAPAAHQAAPQAIPQPVAAAPPPPPPPAAPVAPPPPLAPAPQAPPRLPQRQVRKRRLVNQPPIVPLRTGRPMKRRADDGPPARMGPPRPLMVQPRPALYHVPLPVRVQLNPFAARPVQPRVLQPRKRATPQGPQLPTPGEPVSKRSHLGGGRLRVTTW